MPPHFVLYAVGIVLKSVNLLADFLHLVLVRVMYRFEQTGDLVGAIDHQAHVFLQRLEWRLTKHLQ